MFKYKIKISEDIFFRASIPKHFMNRKHIIEGNILYFNFSIPEYIDENFFAEFGLLNCWEVNI